MRQKYPSYGRVSEHDILRALGYNWISLEPRTPEPSSPNIPIKSLTRAITKLRI